MNVIELRQRISAAFARNRADTLGNRPQATLSVILGRRLASCVLLLLLASLALSGCAPGSDPLGLTVPATVRAETAASAADLCENRFITHDLPHNTTTADGVIRQYEANGAGAAANDLDNDGDLDLVLGNYDNPNSIFWNEGGLHFRHEEMPVGRTRAVSAVDVDGDGWTDLVLTRVGGAINFWRNRGAAVAADSSGRFVQEFLTGLAKPAYAMDWADLDGDGDLDAATASYDIGLTTELGNEYILNDEGGVYIHWNEDGVFRAQRLSTEAQALALAIWDENGDGRPDLLVGNDFALPDEFWRNDPEGWSLATIFPETTHSTMSFDLADVDNSGKTALFASDMKPPDMSEETVQAWAPLMEKEHPPLPAGDPQRMENILLVADRAGAFQSLGRERQLDATGWSWSGLFGDLDRDGQLDLYIVNGFAEATTFAHLDEHELVERNQVLRNTGGGFARMPGWGLGSERGGRGAAQGDLDGDGDLDIVVNNLRGDAQVFENRLCGGASLQVELRQPGSANTAAVGATALLETSAGRLRRDVRVTRGYLSSDPGQLHFGFPAGTELKLLLIRWPDGHWSTVAAPAAGHRLTVTRSDAE
ncbi:MAG: FG-GAP-like repeat-containing protein [Caldilineaceae bacterium]|nr:FG-GAP-like repeat-containing protein [Caldilineaceae bacterium]